MVRGRLIGVDGATVHTHTNRAAVFRGRLGEKRDLVAHGLLALVMPEVAGVVSDLVDVRRNHLSETIVLLKIDGERSVCACTHISKSLDVRARVNGDPYEVGAGALQQFDLRDRRLDVLGPRSDHRLHDDRRTATDRDRPDTHCTSRVARHECLPPCLDRATAARRRPPRSGRA